MHRTLIAVLLVGCSSSSPTTPGNDAGADTSVQPMKDSGSMPDTSMPGQDSAVPGCTTQLDCASTEVCDPVTLTCMAGECGQGSGKSCDSTHICVYFGGATIGACYKSCSPFASGGCPSGDECVIGSMDGVQGYCQPQGTGAAGSMCIGSAVSTKCVPGYVCIPDPSQHFCREQCDFWGSAHACSDTKLCTPPGVCTGDVTDPAAVGTACATTSAAGTLCGPSGGKLLGWCIGMAGATQCDAWCRTAGSDCPMSKSCMPTSVPSIGYCQ